jgi:hypothetical protein
VPAAGITVRESAPADIAAAAAEPAAAVVPATA